MKNTIAFKLATGFGTCMVLLVAVVAVNCSALNRLDRLYRETVKRAAYMELASDARDIGEDFYMIIANAVINRDLAKSRVDWAAAKKESVQRLGKIAAAVETPEDRARIAEAERAMKEIIRIYETLMLPLIERGSTVTGHLSDIDASVDRHIVVIDTALWGVYRSMSDKNQKAEREYHAVLTYADNFGRVFSVAGVLIALLVASLTVRRTVGPLSEITGATRQMRNGNYRIELRHRSDDELGVLADAFRDMSEEVRRRCFETERAKETLESEIYERRAAEEEVRRLNRELEQRVLARTEELHRLSQYLQTVREEERTTISRNIHDDLGQILTALKIDTLWLRSKLPPGLPQLREKTEEMEKHFDEAIKVIRRISAELRPVILDDFGLAAALEWQAQELQRRTGIVCELACAAECDDLDPARATALFRIVQETLTNICRHAEATQVRVTLEARGDEVVAVVTDNGKGIAVQQLNNPRAFGLIGMRERVRSFGGELSIHPLPEGGTGVRATIPLEDGGKEYEDGEYSYSG